MKPGALAWLAVVAVLAALLSPAAAMAARPDDAFEPVVGSVAKVEWPELVGADADAAVAAIELERPDMLLVRATPHDSIVSMDYAVRRVRVFFDPATRRVVRAPRVG